MQSLIHLCSEMLAALPESGAEPNLPDVVTDFFLQEARKSGPGNGADWYLVDGGMSSGVFPVTA